jgi:hypothetical protein
MEPDKLPILIPLGPKYSPQGPLLFFTLLLKIVQNVKAFQNVIL